MHAELMALKHILEAAWSMGFRDIVCETDSQCALDLVKTQ